MKLFISRGIPCFQIKLTHAITVFILFFTFLEQSKAQNLIPVNLVSPEAASLGKFGKIPVGNFTGVPSISIPVYEISLGDINFPVSMDYHAGGIRVNEAASCVGIGWSLNATRIITRSITGLPDESYNYFNAPEPLSVTANPSAYADYLYALGGDLGTNDSQPDVYYYNNRSSSGKFIFRRDGAIYQIPITNNKITKDSYGNFIITEPDGVISIYEEKRRTSTSNVSAPSYINTWCLTKLISSNSLDTVYFKYDQTPRNTFTEQKSSIQNFGAKFEESSSSGQPTFEFVSDYSSSISSTYVNNSEYFLQEISWRGGKMTFTYINDRVDLTGDLRLNGIKVYSKSGTIYSLIKDVKPYQSFVSLPVPANTAPADIEKFSYLRLDSVSFNDLNASTSVEMYRIGYNSIKLPGRGSFAQDRWGFYNGHDENTDLMPKQIFYFLNIYNEFGSANRDVDANKMQAGMISYIQYPTKGKSVFEFEPHQFHTRLKPTELKSISADLCCSDAASYQKTFTVNSNSSNFRFRAFISKYNYPNVTDRPRITLTDLTTGTVTWSDTNMTADTDHNSVGGNVFSAFPYPATDLIKGHTYKILLERFTTTANVTLRFVLQWEEVIPEGTDVAYGGGLRIKSITNYDFNGGFISRDNYAYGNDGAGQVLTPWYYQSLNYEQVVHRYGESSGSGGAGCYYYHEDNPGDRNLSILYPGYSTTFMSSGVLPVSQFSGSPVVYPMVTLYQTNKTGADNGKTVYGYSFSQDSSPPPLYYFSNSSSNVLGDILLQSNEWQNGILLTETKYKRMPTGEYKMVSQVVNTSVPSYQSTYQHLKLKHKYAHGGCLLLTVNDYTLSVNEIRSGAMLTTSSVTTTGYDNGDQVSLAQNFTYGATALLPSTIISTNSRGETLTENLNYPIDFSSPGNVYEKMVNRNILTPVVRHQKLRNGYQISQITTNYYDWTGNSTLLLPKTVDVQIGTRPVETTIRYNEYDSYGNILQQQKSNDMYQSYLWDYSSRYPVARVMNADVSSVAYTSFESNGKGGWTFASSEDATKAFTGNYSHNLSSVIQRSGLITSVRYRLSFWYKDGTPSLSGANATSVSSYVHASGWTYWQGIVTGVNTFSLGGTGVVDELRLYPEGAQMTTFTYSALIGITSSTDPNNVVTYFEYDSYGRLQSVKDDKKNIIKTYQYNYIID